MKKVFSYLGSLSLCIVIAGVVLWKGWLPGELMGHWITWAIEEQDSVVEESTVEEETEELVDRLVITQALWDEELGELVIEGVNKTNTQVEIRIFNIKAELVKTLEIENMGSFVMRQKLEEDWDGKGTVLAFAGENYVVEKAEAEIASYK